MSEEKNEKQWYLITTISGKERTVIESLENRKVSEEMEDLFEDFKVMMVPHLSQREAEKKEQGASFKVRERNLYPGYIFIKMHMTNDAWFIVRNTQYVTGLVGSSGQWTKPTPVPEREIKKMEAEVEKIKENFKQGKNLSPYKVGQVVQVIDGPTKGQIGPIVEVNDERKVAVVELELFERKTPTEIPYSNIKIQD